MAIHLISNTKTKSGLGIKARLDERHYEVTDEKLSAINLKKDDFHGEWSYKIIPNNISKIEQVDLT
jgi:hypothetical protein